MCSHISRPGKSLDNPLTFQWSDTSPPILLNQVLSTLKEHKPGKEPPEAVLRDGIATVACHDGNSSTPDELPHLSDALLLF
jgi:hypothetical protein